jgi:hypothetical protein
MRRNDRTIAYLRFVGKLAKRQRQRTTVESGSARSNERSKGKWLNQKEAVDPGTNR